ncbi:hypothetical protein [Nocardia nova]|uniref:hypothetical protein n=1 Tax=Nocardia nova TaxID=37330 RepID=UPI0033E31B19
MASPNPRTSNPADPATAPVIGSPRTSASGELRRILRLLCCAAFSAGTVVLLFRPWLTVSGPGGTIRSDAFGALGTEGPVQDSWAGSDLRMVEIGGGWAIFACVAAVAVIVAAVGYLCTRTAMFAHAATVAGAVLVLSVLGDVLYLWGKAYELRTLVEDGGLSGVVGSLLGNTDTADAAASTHFGIAALLAGLAALGAAVSALLNYQPAVPARTSAAPVPASATRRAGTTPAPSSRRSVSDSARARRERALTRAVPAVAHQQPVGAQLAPADARPEPDTARGTEVEPITARPTPAVARLGSAGAQSSPAVTLESDAEPIAADGESGPAYRVVEPDPAVAAREPSWRIVIPAAEAYGRTSGVRTVTRAGR